MYGQSTVECINVLLFFFLVNFELFHSLLSYQLEQLCNIVVILLGVFAEVSPKWFDFIFDHYVPSVCVDKYGLLELVSAILELSFDMCLILDEQRSLNIIQDPRCYAVWLMHVQPQRCTAFEFKLWALIFFEPSDFVRLFQIVGAYYGFSELIEFLRYPDEVFSNGNSIMHFVCVSKSHILEQLLLSIFNLFRRPMRTAVGQLHHTARLLTGNLFSWFLILL